MKSMKLLLSTRFRTTIPDFHCEVTTNQAKEALSDFSHRYLLAIGSQSQSHDTLLDTTGRFQDLLLLGFGQIELND